MASLRPNRQGLAQHSAVICAWCKVVLQRGVGPISHGVCNRCRVTRLEAALRRLPLPAPTPTPTPTTANGEPSERRATAGPNEEAA